MLVLIPAFEPDARLVDLVAELRAAAPHAAVLVVDDGSGAEYDLAFDLARAAGAEVIGHAVNRGKGAALKTGFRQALWHHPGEVVVCADSDGQHRVADVLRVAGAAERAARAHPSTMVLGGRRFTGDVPARSRFGNAVSCGLFRLATGLRLGDTQTGLRAYPPGLLPWLVGLPGDRFEYELTVLLESRAAGHRIEELEIDTVYLERNASSHFRPVVDSWRVLRPLLRYAASSAAAFVVDVLLLQLLVAVTGSLVLSAVGARVVSASVNFAVNRRFVFRKRSRRPAVQDALRYAALVAVLLAANVGLLELLTAAGAPLLVAKLVTEATLYLVGFAVQRRVVFAAGRGQAEGCSASGSAAAVSAAAGASAAGSVGSDDDFLADCFASRAAFSAFSEATVEASRPGSGRSRKGLLPPLRE
ncbi:GtrA family protein [Herbiconiux sp. P18]|uniref:GtrA family protein n=1 Tax=Herbiconiux liangxiaofengii TaxID=3342795 RepID=UPI0035B6B683